MTRVGAACPALVSARHGLATNCPVLYAAQAEINAILEVIFHIKSGFIGKLVSNLARVRLADVVDDANDKHMQPWADLCAVRFARRRNRFHP